MIDVGWSQSSQHKGQVETLRLTLHRFGINLYTPKHSPGKGIDVSAFAGTVKSYLHTLSDVSHVVFLVAPVFRDWQKIRNYVDSLNNENPKYLIAVLSKSEIWNTDAALSRIADAIFRSDLSNFELEEKTEPDSCIGGQLRTKFGYADPCVLIVGGNERQQSAKEQFPAEILRRFGVRGYWILADYKRPERVTEQIRQLCESETKNEQLQIVAAAFMQRFNATNAKRDGMEMLRKKECLYVSAPQFKSLGSAIDRIQDMLVKLLSCP